MYIYIHIILLLYIYIHALIFRFSRTRFFLTTSADLWRLFLRPGNLGAILDDHADHCHRNSGCDGTTADLCRILLVADFYRRKLKNNHGLFYQVLACL